MPKRHADRRISERGERNLANRVQRERANRAWSYGTLARKMTDVGCPMSKAALYGIEQGDPPRRITVDELMAFAEVFTDGDVSDLLTPVELLDQRRAGDARQDRRRLVGREGSRVNAASIRELIDALRAGEWPQALVRIGRGNPDGTELHVRGEVLAGGYRLVDTVVVPMAELAEVPWERVRESGRGDGS